MDLTELSMDHRKKLVNYLWTLLRTGSLSLAPKMWILNFNANFFGSVKNRCNHVDRIHDKDASVSKVRGIHGHRIFFFEKQKTRQPPGYFVSSNFVKDAF